MSIPKLAKNQIYLEWGDCTSTIFAAGDTIRREFYQWHSTKRKNVPRDLVELGVEDEFYRYYNPISQRIPRGHIKYAIAFAREKGYEIIKGENIKKIMSFEFDTDMTFVDSLTVTIKNKIITPYDHQRNFVEDAIKYRSLVGISATGSGKTLILYLISRHLLNETKNGKILIIVPSVTLMTQGLKDMKDFASQDSWDVDEHVTLLGGGKAGKNTDLSKKIVIATWQSLKGKRKQFYEQFLHVMVDEVHGADADVLKRIIERCTNAYTKIGMTGSLKGTGKDIDVHSKKVLEGLFGGRINVYSTVADLIRKGILPDLKILPVLLKYDSKIKKRMDEASEVEQDRKLSKEDKLKLFQEERNFIGSLPERTDALTELVNRMKGNVIIFFNSVDRAKEAYEQYQGSKQSRLIYGGVGYEERDRILYEEINVDTDNEYVLFATYGTLSTGISVDTLDIGMMWESMKSRVKVMQSIGRLLRGNKSLIVDIGDRLTSKNYLFKHWEIRQELYFSEEYNVLKTRTINIQSR